MLHSLPSEEELGAALPGKFWVTCLFLSQSTAARGWDILIGLLGHLVPSWTNHLAQEDTMLSLATHVAVPASGGGWVQLNPNYLAECGRLLVDTDAVSGEQVGAERTPLALLVSCG